MISQQRLRSYRVWALNHSWIRWESDGGLPRRQSYRPHSCSSLLLLCGSLAIGISLGATLGTRSSLGFPVSLQEKIV